ncbi:MAG: SMP-30/gluconolactonase/LRE family protein [Alphaproteobacteria bacterium]|nr:SMP-30/gluconolactonase/LRE family protein [Alphaproteobacteria bacterium]
MRGSGLLLVAGCAAGAGSPDDTDTDTLDVQCPAPGAPEVVVDGLVGGSEGVAVAPDGAAFVVAADRLVEITPEGGVTDVAPVRGGVGAVWWRDAVWVATGKDASGADAPALVEVSRAGEVTRHPLQTLGRPNFLAPTPWGTLLVSDDFDTRIAEWRDGADTIWAEEVPSPNGMGFSADGRALFVASTFGDEALRAIAVEGEVAGALSLLAPFPDLSAPDGLVVAADGSVLVALNLTGEIHRWDGDRAERVAEGLPFVASLAFGPAPWDPCSVLATSLFGEEVWSVPVGVAGP